MTPEDAEERRCRVDDFALGATYTAAARVVTMVEPAGSICSPVKRPSGILGASIQASRQFDTKNHAVLAAGYQSSIDGSWRRGG